MPLFFIVESLKLHYSYNNSNYQALEPKFMLLLIPQAPPMQLLLKK